MSKNFDIIVVGAGIAGVAIAEMLSRSGKSVALIEKNQKIGSEASADHHGWYHMGSLYSIFRKNIFPAALLSNFEQLINFYSHFDNMNIKISTLGKIETASNLVQGWFTGHKINYYLACHNDTDFQLKGKSLIDKFRIMVLKIGWHLYIRKFIQRHNLFYNYNFCDLKRSKTIIPKARFWHHSREVISWLPNAMTNLDRNTHINVAGYDQTLRARIILSDLLTAFEQKNGSLLTSKTVEKITRSENIYTVHCADESFTARKVIVASGKFIDEINMDQFKSVKVKKIISPLAVVTPRLMNDNFVRMTPFVEKSINHLLHSVDNVEYSVVGGGYQLPADAGWEQRQSVEENLVSNINNVFKGFEKSKHSIQIYWGTKTEVTVGTNDRNYDYSVQRLDDNLFNVVPGKFSLCFGLAVSVYKVLLHELPPSSQDMRKITTQSSHSKTVEQTHYRKAMITERGE